MSVVVAIVGPDHAVMGADRRVSYGTHYRDTQTKIFQCGDMLVGVAGSPLASRFVRTYRKRFKAEGCYTELQWAELLAQDLHKSLREQGHGMVEGGVMLHPVELLFAAPDFIADGGGYGGVEVARRHCAVGSGAPYALGALEVMSTGSLSARAIEDQCRLAIKAAIGLDSTCGGDVDLLALSDRVEVADV